MRGVLLGRRRLLVITQGSIEVRKTHFAATLG
jgi:hypothetical protein